MSDHEHNPTLCLHCDEFANPRRTSPMNDGDSPADLPGRCRDDDEQADRAEARETAHRGWRAR